MACPFRRILITNYYSHASWNWEANKHEELHDNSFTHGLLAELMAQGFNNPERRNVPARTLAYGFPLM
jgi:hypothetical protein